MRFVLILVALVTILWGIASANPYPVSYTTYDTSYDAILKMYIRVLNAGGDEGRHHDLFNTKVIVFDMDTSGLKDIPKDELDRMISSAKHSFGYMIRDLNGDGVDELIIGDHNGNVIELDETISLNSNSSLDEDNDYNKNINKNKNNLQLNNQIYKIPKKINYIDKNKLIDLKIEMNINSIKERIKNQLLQRKRIIEDNIKINKNQIQKKKEGEEVIDVSSQSINESSNFIPIDNEINHQFSTNSN